MASVQGFFANPEIGGPKVAGVWYKLPGDGHTNGRQLGWQICGVVITIGFTAVVTALIVSKFADVRSRGVRRDCLRERFPRYHTLTLCI